MLLKIIMKLRELENGCHRFLDRIVLKNFEFECNFKETVSHIILSAVDR